MRYVAFRWRALAGWSRRAWLRFQMRARGARTTKVCPVCFGECMVPLRSLNLKICNNCRHEIPWHLGDDQQSTLQPSRATRKGTAT